MRAASAIDALGADDPDTIALAMFSARGELRRNEVIRTSSAGRITQAVELKLGVDRGELAGNGRWTSYITGGATFLGDGDAVVISFATPSARLGLTLGGSDGVVPLANDDRNYRLDLSGAQRGVFRFHLDVDPAACNKLGIGMRYFEPTNLPPPKANIVAHTYPLYALDGVQRFEFALDLAAPYEEEVGGAGVVLPRSMVYPPAAPLKTHLHAIHGQPVSIARAANAPHVGFRLVKSPKVLSLSTGVLAELDHALTPHGPFRVTVGTAAAFRLGLGLSNMESLHIDSANGDLLQFELGPALITGANAVAAAAGEELQAVNGQCRTAWVRYQAGRAGTRALSLDPEGMPGYVGPVTGAMQFKATRLSPPDIAFPMVGLLGLTTPAASSPAARLQVERNVLARVRREKLGGASSLPAMTWMAGDPQEARTPQGYLAERPSDGAPWSRIIFGQTARQDSGTPATHAAAFGISATTVDAKLQLATVLAGNRLFLVTRKAQLVALGFDSTLLSELVMAGWGATLGDDAIVIIKYDDRAISDIYADQRNWTAAAKFCPPPLAARATAKLEAALVSDSDYLTPLQQRLKNPNWNGVLVLDATLSTAGLPEQLAAIAPGLPGSVNVHHLGIDLSAIDPFAATNGRWPTAMFGLVNYDGSNGQWAGADNEDPVFSMRVSKLVLRVENDTVDRFECTVQLKILQMFGVAAERAANGEPKILNLVGTYEARVNEARVNEAGVRQDRYSFAASAVDGALFKLTFADPSIVASVQIDRVSLLTVLEGGVRQGRYVLDGNIDLRQIGEFDLLGVDGLAFNGFGIQFNLLPFGAIHFDYPSLRFDLEGFNRGAIKRRAGSLLNKFPLKLRGFRFGDFNLAKLGFFSLGGIKLPTDKYEPSADFQFGFDFDLDLGSLGALAKKLDRFKLQLVIGWKPHWPSGSPNLRNFFAIGFRLDLGEGAGGIDLGLEGVLRLTAEKFNLKRVSKDPAKPDEKDVFILSADDCVLQVLGQRLPKQPDQRFTLFLFCDLGQSAGAFARPGWFASFEDKNPESPVALNRLTMAQRVNVHFDELESANGAVEWLGNQLSFGRNDTDRFVKFASESGVLTYAPSREWFIAGEGTFFDIAQLALVLRDPDLYGAYIGLLNTDPKALPLMSLDLLYEKMADGVGRYVGEVLPPDFLRRFDAGAVSVSLGVIHAELYTNGGFLVDLGMPKDMDYRRSFVVQGGPFIGKGGVFIGYVPREAVPALKFDDVGHVFRAGIALRIGLGREFERGPIRAGLSVSVFGRVEGAIARFKSQSGYAIALYGEVGIIAEIEGVVDLRLIRARLLIRLWVASGIALVTGEPVRLFCEAGVQVSVEVVIGKIRVFGRTIKISVRLSYRTRLRFEWELPARVPAQGLLKAHAPRLADPPTWAPPSIGKLDVTPTPFRLRLAFDAIRAQIDGAPVGRAVPSFLWIADDGLNAGQQPFEVIGRALVGWAAMQLAPDAASANQIVFCNSELDASALGFVKLRAQLQSLGDIDPDLLQTLFASVFSGSRLDMVSDGASVEAYAFPAPPGLVLDVGGTSVDLDTLGALNDSEVSNLVDHLDNQFAEIERRPARLLAASGKPLSLTTRLFREWCQLLALTVVEAMESAFDPHTSKATHLSLGELWNSIERHWPDIAGRTGRLFYSGVRALGASGYAPLLEQAGWFLDVAPKGMSDVRIVGTGASTWLIPDQARLPLDGERIALFGTLLPRIDAQTDLHVPSIRWLPRAFVQGPHVRVADREDSPTRSLLVELSADLRAQLDHPASPEFPAELLFFARQSATVDQSEIVEQPLATPLRTLVFDMAIERVPVQNGPASAMQDRSVDAVKYLPDCFQVAGTSELERRGLDALLSGDATALTQRLNGSTLRIGWKATDASGNTTFVRPDLIAEDVSLARATVSVERRPFPDRQGLALAAPSDDESFYATLANTDRLRFLSILQRAASVNSGGTYLILPASVALALSKRFEALTQIQLTFFLQYAPGASLPHAAINAVSIENAADIATVAAPAAKPRVVVAKLADAAAATQLAPRLPGLVEAVALRPPGTEMVRVWRSPPDAQESTVLEQRMSAHLGSQFDMLEFQVEDDAGRVLIKFDESLPLGSERAVPSDGPEQLKSWLAEEATRAGYAASSLRYDLLLPLARLAEAAGKGIGPYAGVGRNFVVKLGWRDIYGNRLGAWGKPEIVRLTYHDPLTALDAWPGICATYQPGAAGTNSLEMTFAPDNAYAPGQSASQLATTGLRRVADQLGGPGVDVTVASGLGAVANAKLPVADLASYLRGVAAYLDGAGKLPGPFTYVVHIPKLGDQPYNPLNVTLTVTRDSALVANDAAPGVQQIACQMKSTLNDQSFAAAFQNAFTPKGSAALVWAAVGTTDDGRTGWWSVDARVIPTRSADKARCFAPRPLALSPMSVEVTAPLLDPSGVFAKLDERNVTIRAHDRDSDEMLSLFLTKIDEFLSPLNAPMTARVPASSALGRPFDRVAKAKLTLLGRLADASDSLLMGEHVVGLRERDDDPLARGEALTMLREACAADLQRYGSVGSVLVQSLGSAMPSGWFADGSSPKLYGQVTFGNAAGTLKGFRALTRGIDLHNGRMDLAMAILPDSPDAKVVLSAAGPVSYRITHVERVVEGGGAPGKLATSRWLSIVPVKNGADANRPSLPVVDIARAGHTGDTGDTGDTLEAPTPTRSNPKPPVLWAPTVAYSGGATSTSYQEAVAMARRWRYGFDLQAEFRRNDQFCARMIYNAPLGAQAIATQTPAQPVFPGLLERLVGFEARIAPYWPVIAAESARRVARAGTAADQSRFNNACERFAEAVECVLSAFRTTKNLRASTDLLEDRFIIKDTATATGRKTEFSYHDHLQDDNPPPTPHAGDGKLDVQIFQMLSDQPQKGVKTTLGPLSAAFEFNHTESGPIRRRVDIGGLDAVRLQSVWVAGSVRRNANIDDIKRCFVYRTPEVYLQQVVVPNLVNRASIALPAISNETLAQRLERALRPVFEGQLKDCPVQIRFDYESGRMVDLVDSVLTPGMPDFLPEPDPKIQFAGVKVGEGVGALGVGEFCLAASRALVDCFASEPVDASGRLVVAVTLRTVDGAGQPLLRLGRLLVPLAGVSDRL
ncbi:hypothetical protein UC34_12225 [Pandoraea vervacti]|uniref:Uncharacterized protein n=2 Tax=Pandoraea vervacti TaxID=656178 RepID=A0ABN4FPG2_9BURK|nr:hypothetical protein UC34_12225 [Pandoraea vervacti]